jgi:hypothetical protein
MQMDPYPISTELAELENRLRRRAGDEPSADLRDRVLSAAANELAVPRRFPNAGQWDSGWWAACAAGLLIVLNLSMVCASENEFSIRPGRGTQQQITTEMQAVRQIESQQEGLLK